jgi:hypothetical protein
LRWTASGSAPPTAAAAQGASAERRRAGWVAQRRLQRRHGSLPGAASCVGSLPAGRCMYVSMCWRG